MSPLIPLKLNFNGPPPAAAECVCVGVCACLLLHSQLPLQVERLLRVVMTAAQADEGGVRPDGHVVFVLLLQLKGALQVLRRQRDTQKYRAWSQKRMKWEGLREAYLFSAQSMDGLFKNGAQWFVLRFEFSQFAFKSQNFVLISLKKTKCPSQTRHAASQLRDLVVIWLLSEV